VISQGCSADSGLAGARLLILGGAGFIGSQVVRDACALGADVTVFDDLSAGAAEHIAGLERVRLLEGDIADERRLAAAFLAAQPDFVVNLVGDTFVPDAYREPKRFFRINVDGTLNVLLAARRARPKRVLHASTTEVYGEVADRPADETHPLNPLNTYAVSKLAGDRLCFTFAAEHGVSTLIARLFNSYGPRATHPYVIPEIISQLCRGPVLELGNLEARRDFSYVEDTARALLTLLGSDLPSATVVNVGSGTSVSVRELAQAIARVFGYQEIEIRRDPSRLRHHDIHQFVADASLLRSLGWEPRVDLATGLLRTVEAYRAAGCEWIWERRLLAAEPGSGARVDTA
jgi:nucleoside-diphosphate-sugar epimerase